MDFLFNNDIPDTDYIYDIETFPNIFTAAYTHALTGTRYFFEISSRRDDSVALVAFMNHLELSSARMVGFNNVGFDYIVIHKIVTSMAVVTVAEIYEKAMAVISAHDNAKFAHIIRDYDVRVEQIDLFKIHHFDNKAKMTSLKTIEINMVMDNVEDLPFPVGTMLTEAQMEVLCTYNWHDVDATYLFYQYSQPMIKFREELSIKYDKNFMNFNDAKIGSEIFIYELEKNGISCYEQEGKRKRPRQTVRESIDLRECIFPYINLTHPEFQRIHAWLQAQVITETKGVFTDLRCTIDNIEYIFGLGGLHAAADNEIFEADDDHVIELRDVVSYYPNMSIKNRIFPAHLSEKFCDIYGEVFDERTSHPKGTMINLALKLALNATFGNSNNKYSPFYDPAFTMSITVGGQLSLCMLIERLLLAPGLRMINCNTDGVAYICPKTSLPYVEEVCEWWKSVTKLDLETEHYNRFFSRDVNNYSGEGLDGKVKRKGAYCYGKDLQWNQNHSKQIAAKAAQAALVDGEDIAAFLHAHPDPRDFLLMTKVPRKSNLALQVNGQDVIVPNIVRYVVTTDGAPLSKIMPPAGPEGEYKRANKLTDTYFDSVIDEIGPGVWDERVHTKNKSIYEERRGSVEAGYMVTICNDIQQLNNVNIDYSYYIKQVEKLVNPLRGE